MSNDMKRAVIILIRTADNPHNKEEAAKAEAALRALGVVDGDGQFTEQFGKEHADVCEMFC